MLHILDKTRKFVSTLLIFGLLVAPICNSRSLAASESRVKVTNVPSMLWGGLGQYVEYELDGVTYRTDETSSSINRKAWSLMNQEDRRKTYDRLFTTSARKAAFGEEGWQDVVGWIRETNEWFIANRLWKDRIAKRDFPQLHVLYNDQESLSTLFPDYDEMKNYQIPSIVSHNNMARERFNKNLVELDQYYSVGKEYFKKVRYMRGKSIGMVASFTMMQVTEMLSDMLFLPSVSNLITIPRSGMIADLIDVVQESLGLEGGDLLEKVNTVLEGGEQAHLTVEEQVKLYAALIESYAILAERYYSQVENKIEQLRNDYRVLVDHAEYLEYSAQETARERELEKVVYEKDIEDQILMPQGREPEEDEPTATLAFKWKTEDELKLRLFNNNINDWIGTFEDNEIAYEKAAEIIFEEIKTQKGYLDNETQAKISSIVTKLLDSYSSIVSNVQSLENQVTYVLDSYSKLSEDEYDFYRIKVGELFFYGDDRFSPELEDYAYSGKPYDFYYGDLRSHIEIYQSKIEDLKGVILEIKDSYSNFMGDSYKKDIEDFILYLDLLRELENNYLSLYNNPVWELNSVSGVDNSQEYSKIPYIYPNNHEEYLASNFKELLSMENLPEDIPKYLSELEDLAINRPRKAYNDNYVLYEGIIVMESLLLEAYSATLKNETLYIDGCTSYYDEMEDRLATYLDAQDKMNNAFSRIRTMVDEYEGLWQGTYFLGSYDNYNYQPYLYNTGLVSISAFDIASLRSFIRSGGNTTIIINQLKSIERKAEEYEVKVADLIGQINCLDIEMNLLGDDILVNYAVSKGENLMNFYSLREKYSLFSRWDELTMSNENSLAYFNICDIPQMIEILSGETDDYLFMKDSIHEIQVYKNTGSVDIYSTSNRLYDIYRHTTGIRDIYQGNIFDNYSLYSESYRTKMLNLYANPGDGEDILNSISEVKTIHQGIDYTYPPSIYEDIDLYNPVGEPEAKANLPGSVRIQANIYHPLAVNAGSIAADLYVYENGWRKVNSISQSGDLDIYLDPINNKLVLPFDNLEDGREYRVDWKITHAPYGVAQYEEGNHYFTYAFPKGIFTSVELNKDTYDSAEITIINNSDNNLDNRKMTVDGFDHEGILVDSQVEELDLLIGEEKTVTIYFDEVVYDIKLSIEGIDNQEPEEWFEIWPQEYIPRVLKDKRWRVQFNSTVDMSTVILSNIFIKNQEGEIQDIEFELDEEDEKGQTIILNPPQGGYVDVGEYTIYISKNIKNLDGIMLTNGIVMKFYVE